MEDIVIPFKTLLYHRAHMKDDKDDILDGDWFRKRVRVDPYKMFYARTVLTSVNKIVYNKLRRNLPEFNMSFTELFVIQGSAADGTKVGAPDEFDILMPIKLNADKWEVVPTQFESSVLKTFHCIRGRRNKHGKELFKSSYNNCNKRCLSASERKLAMVRYAKERLQLSTNNQGVSHELEIELGVSQMN